MADDFIPDNEDDFSPEPHNADQALDAYEKGMHAYDNGDVERSRHLLEASLMMNPNLAEAKNALERMSFTKTESSTRPSTLEGYREGYQRYLQGDLGGAKKRWEENLMADPGSFESREGLQRIKNRGGI